MDYQELQVKIFTDMETREAFCNNPREFLTSHGMEIPENAAIPDSISLEDMENQIAATEERLNQRGLKFGPKLLADMHKNLSLRNDICGTKPEGGAVVVAVGSGFETNSKGSSNDVESSVALVVGPVVLVVTSV